MPPRHLLQRALTPLITFLAVLALGTLAPAAAQATPCTAPVVNKVACENYSQTGVNPENWMVDGNGDDTIQGFATQMSVQPGDTIGFKIKSSTSNYHIDILRLGYYQGLGARYMQQNLTPTSTAAQPACKTFSDSGLVDCGNWSVSRSWTVPTTAVSGVYIAHLVRNDTGGDSNIIFVVRDDSSHSDVVVQTSDATWQAYNTWGGNSLYTCTVACPDGDPKAYKAAYKVSYNRPLETENASGLFTGAEFSMISFLEANGYDVSYVSGVDAASRGTILKNHKLFISSGHDEYWSSSQRTAMEAARDAGTNLAFFSGNEGFWKTRWENSADGANTPYRTLVSYKDTHFDGRQDPVEWTGSWRDSRFTTDAENVKPENNLTGQLFVVNSGTTRITVPAAFGKLRMWRNTAAASLTGSQTLQLAPDTLGYEWDVDADNGFRPAGAFQLSSTTASNVEVFTDYGSTTVFPGTATHNMTLYRAPSGARVFGAGTVQWAWGLSDANPEGNPVDRNMQQATVNLFADMGAQPATLASNLTAATKTTDTTAPTASISSPPSTVADGAKVTISGTASDSGGGVVGGVEISTDGGTTWHPTTLASAQTSTTWSYSWIAHGAPSTTLKVRATDDSGNIQTPGAGVSVAVTCSCSLFGDNVKPAVADAGDTSAVEVGVKFQTSTFGTVSGVRFYKAAANTGTHIGSLWTEDGTRLAQVTFSGESASGWQTATFSTPVPIQPNTTYVVSYFSPTGHYAATADYFYRTPAPGPAGGAIADSPPLKAIRNTGTTGNGVYSYGSGSTFPVNSYGAGNYWVDVAFAPTPAPGQVTNVSAVEGGTSSANVTWSAPATGGTPTTYKITAYVGSTATVTKTVDAPATSATVTGLTTGTTYRFTVQAINPNGSGAASAQSNAVTPTGPVAPSAPTGVAAQPATSSARVTWTGAASDGDSAIVSQTVTPYIGTTAQTPVTVSASARAVTVTGLLNSTSYTFKVTATNGVGNSPASGASNAVTPQATIFDFTTPTGSDYVDNTGIEIGMKFKADYTGTVTGVRFYKGTNNTGTHVGSIWSSTGTRLAQATFTGETASGWQSVTFASPVTVTAGTTYVASYFSPLGGYTASAFGLASQVDNGPLHALANSTSVNGVYTYSATSAFPTSTYDAGNYWVDVLYALPKPGQATGATATEGGPTSANVSWTAPSSGGPVTGYVVTPYAGTTAGTPKVVSSTATSTTVTGLTTGTTYTFKVAATNSGGAGPDSAASNAVTPSVPVVPTAPTNVAAVPATSSARVTWTPSAGNGGSTITSQTVTPYVNGSAQSPVSVSASATSTTITGLTNGTAYTFKVTATNGVGESPASAASAAATPQNTIYDFATPSITDGNDTLPVELGVKFKASFTGSVTGIRFYKASGNTGTHTGSLWNASGTRLAQGTFTGESDSGWQTLTFATPVAITADTTYVASYFAPNGHYSATVGGLSSAISNGPLTALANSTSTNGVYAYGAASSFPNSSYESSSYFVDVLFAQAPPPGAPSGVTATAGQTSATVSWTAPSSGGPVTSYKITPYIGSTAQTSKTITGTPPATSTTITGLTAGTSYTFKVSGANPTGTGPDSAASNAVTPTSADLPGTPSSVTAQADSGAAILTWTAPSAGGSALNGYTITPYIGAAAQTPVTLSDGTATSARVTGLTAGSAYTFTVRASNPAGTGPASAPTTAVTPQTSIFGSATPAILDGGDGGSIVLGVKFRSDVAGTVTGIRFHKAATNTGTHIGALWSGDQNLLAQGTFTNETATGWQAVTFATPVDIQPNVTYVASYLAPNGHYSVTGSGLASAFDTPPLHALSNSVSANGIFKYSSTLAFPNDTYSAGNYWVDVLFTPAGS